jgi:Protein of unknown function (DUF3551)
MHEAIMRNLLFLLGALVVLAGTGTRAEAQNYPWCALYDAGTDVRNCGFVTYDQCLATVRGIGGFCMVNNTYQPEPGASRRHPG